MPPANSPNGSPPSASEDTSPYLQSLAAISSPVPDLAATLMTPDEQEINEANTDFLRTRIPESTDDESNATDLVDYHTLLDWYNRARDRQETFRTQQRAQERDSQIGRSQSGRSAGYWQSRSRPSWVQERRREISMSRQGGEPHDGDSNYANRTTLRQSLYDWAPYAPISDDPDRTSPQPPADAEDDDLPSYASYARYRWLERRQNYDHPRTERTPPRRQPRDEPSGRTTLSSLSESLRNEMSVPPRLGSTWSERSSQRDWERTRRDQLSSTQALLRSVDRHRRTQPRTGADPGWQSYLASSGSREDSARTSTRLHRSELDDDALLNPLSHGSAYNMMPGANVLRKKFLSDPLLSRLKDTMRYLSDLRHCTEPRQIQGLMDTHFPGESSVTKTTNDIIRDLNFNGPTESSWLTHGASFKGVQSASILSADQLMFVRHPERWERSRYDARASPGPNNTSSRIHHSPNDIFVTTSFGRTYAADPLRDTSASYEGPNSWPVTVTIDTLDLPNLTLTGTMSASKIRDKRSPTGESSSTTYFEGEIIDFKTNGLETENFESEGLETDVLYWMRIGPFKGMTDDEISQRLLQRQWIEEELLRNWILMRWKERTFIPPTPSPNPGGISIRGFYYIALHRPTGRIDGSYGNHPESQPYQSLRMAPADIPFIDEYEVSSRGTGRSITLEEERKELQRRAALDSDEEDEELAREWRDVFDKAVGGDDEDEKKSGEHSKAKDMLGAETPAALDVAKGVRKWWPAYELR